MPITKQYTRHSIGLTRNKKLRYIKRKHERKIYDAVRSGIADIWEQCHVNYQDGILNMTADEIELIADWPYDEGVFYEIVTHPKSQFIDIINGEGTQHKVHKWIENNPQYAPEYKEKKSKAGALGAAETWHKGIVFNNLKYPLAFEQLVFDSPAQLGEYVKTELTKEERGKFLTKLKNHLTKTTEDEDE